MKCPIIRINYKRIKQLPKSARFFCLILGVFCLLCMIQSIALDQTLSNLQECTIDIERVYLLDSHDVNGSRMKLVIVSDNATYYVWYPQGKYVNFAQEVESELLTGNVTSLQGKAVKIQSVRDYLLNRKRIVDLRNGDYVFYNLETEIHSAQRDGFFLGLCLFIAIVVFLFYTFFICIIYRVVVFKK